MGAMPREESSARVEYSGQHREHEIAAQSARQQIRARERQECMQCQFPFNRLRCDPDQEKRPVQRIPRARLRIAQKRKARKNEWRPVRQTSFAHSIGEIFLRGIMDIDRIPLNRRLGIEQRREVKEDRRQRERGPDLIISHGCVMWTSWLFYDGSTMQKSKLEV